MDVQRDEQHEKEMTGRNSSSLFQRSLRVAPSGVHSPVRSFQSVGGTPIFFQSAQGPYLQDVEGRRYIDFCLSFGPLILGHRHPEVEAAVREMVSTAWSLGACESYSLELAEYISSHIPWAEKVRFVSSGTEAVMSALRIARAATGREKIIKFEGCYHGHFDQLLVEAGSGLAGESSASSAGLSSSVAKETYLLPLDDEGLAEALIEKEADKIALLIIEPLPANYGLLVQRREFLRRIVAAARRRSILVLFDEVISGFRIGFQGMAGELQIEPDLVCYGKIIGGGFPAAAYAGKRQLMDLAAPSGAVYQAGTLSAHPVAMRAGLATLQKCRQENFYSDLEENMRWFGARLQDLLDQFVDQHQHQGQPADGSRGQGQKRSQEQDPYSGQPGWDVASYASLFWICRKDGAPLRSVSAIPKGQKESYSRLFHSLLKAGIYLPPSGYEVASISCAHERPLLEEALERIESALLNQRQSG